MRVVSINPNLSDIGTGEPVRIVAIGGGRGLREKLNLRGISEGHIVRVISANGPITIEAGRSIISIGRGMAKKIRVIRV